jgi:hypothetical protein
MNEVRMAADRTILGILLAHPGRQIDRDDHFFAARTANVAGFFLHVLFPVARILPRHYGGP